MEAVSFLQNVIIGQYYPGNSLIHRLDPRGKILFMLWFFIIVFLVDTSASYIFLVSFVILVASISRIPASYMLKGIKPLWWIIAFTMLIHLYATQGGDLVWEWKGITIYEEGIRQAVYLSIRLILLITIASLLTLTTSPIDLTEGLERLLQPFKRWGFPAHEFAFMMSVAIRFIPTLADEADKIMKAQAARGADFESRSFSKRVNSFITLLVPLFIGAFRRAEDLALAMEARGYKGGDGRTRRRTMTFQRLDYTLPFIAVVVSAILIYLDGAA